MFREDNFHSGRLAEDPVFSRRDDGSDDLEPNMNIEEEEAGNEKLIELSRSRFENLKDSLDEEFVMIIESIIAAIEANYNPEDENDPFIKKLARLLNDVIVQFEKGHYDQAENNLLDLEQEMEQMS
jgi:hypothetical protein